MNTLIDAAFSRSRAVMLALLMLIAFGSYAYVTIPKEAAPEVPLPYFIATTVVEGISPEDGEALLLQPLEREFSSVDGLKKMSSVAMESAALVLLEFEPGTDADDALGRLRDARDRANADLPDSATTVELIEINTEMFPILSIILSGPVPERTLSQMAEELQTEIEKINGVLEAEIGGEREEFLEILIDPTVFQTYGLTFDELLGQVQANNRLIAAGAMDIGRGRMALKVPGLITTLQDLQAMPVKVRDGTVVSLGDIATIRQAFEDPEGFVRFNGQPALSLEVTKRSGANVIEIVNQVMDRVEAAREGWPESVQVTYQSDQSDQIKTMLSELEASVIAAVVLVMIVIVYALGLRSAILVGVAIPGSFLVGVATIWLIGYTLNIIVLFALILVVGMLVDGAIVTTDLADRRLQEGAPPKEAYAYAAKRMAWPIIASTATTLSVFFPLLFWTGIMGEFMKYLPATVILTLIASLFIALIFVPVLGGLIGRRQPRSASAKAALAASEHGDPRALRGFTGAYARLLDRAVRAPGVTLLIAVAVLLGAFQLYGLFGRGVTYFPDVEPEALQVEVRARDSFSIYERDALVRQVEQRLFGFDEIDGIYARSALNSQLGNEEVIGTINLELADWQERRKADVIASEIREAVADIAGVEIQVQSQSNGPSQGKPVEVRVISPDPEVQSAAVSHVREVMARIGGFTDVEDDRSLPGVELAINVDRAEAARYGASVTLLGQAVQLLTRGVDVSTYRPPASSDEYDIRVRFPQESRNLSELANLRVPTSAGQAPVLNFVSFEPVDRTGTIRRTDERRVLTIEADVQPGLLVNDQMLLLSAALAEDPLPGGASFELGGEAEEQAEASSFLVFAFVAAIALMFAILLIQMNNFYQVFVVLSAIVFSVAGVLLGLIIIGRPFGVVMGGIGVIALAGIVVNNNIVLIDTYNEIRATGASCREAALRAGAQRLRPVVLTSLTTALGLMPMVLGVTLDVFSREILVGAPSSQWWTELSSAIAGGLIFATVLTLVLTPSMLVLRDRRRERRAAA